MERVYVVIGTSGEYSDRVWWTHRVFATKAEAEAAAEALAAIERKRVADRSDDTWLVRPYGYDRLRRVSEEVLFSVEEAPFGPEVAS